MLHRTANRRMVVALLLSVAVRLRIIESSSVRSSLPPRVGANSISDDYPHIRIIFIEANLDCLIYTACCETGAFVPDEDLAKDPVRNRFSILLRQTQVSSYRLGQNSAC